MKILIILPFLLVAITAIICDQPQRKFYMSFPTLSKRDHISNLFQEINPDIPTYENSYTDSSLQANFKISNVHPQIYYNDHYQKDTYIDKYRANVTMGVLAASTYFNFTINYKNKNTTGNIRAVGTFDPSYFTKNLSLIAGYLQWKPDVVPALTFSNMFHIEFYTPALTQDQLNIFTKLVNGLAGNNRIKQDFTNHVNARYAPLLADHLNNQQLIGSNNITYSYRNINMTFINYAKEFELSNDMTKGLEVSLLFGLESSTQNCTKLPTDFDQDQYGGLQQLYTMSSVRSMIKEGISKGLFDIILDRSWQVSGFQFYMGDLGNFVPYANFLPSNDNFTVRCKYNASREAKSLKILRYDVHDLYVGVPLSCTLNYQNNDILAVDMDTNFIVRLYGEDQSVRVDVLSAGVFGDSYRSIDPKFQVTSVYLAKHFIGEVLNGLVGKTVFGNGFPLIKRRYPVIQIFDQMLVVFDPSEP